MFNKGVTWFFRLIVGLLFIFSGAIKANDILGFTYRLEDYFSVFGMSFMDPLATPIAIAICILEIFLGVSLLLGTLVTFTVNTLLGMIIFFTFLTFYSAYTGKVTDCGCFGDAIPLTPWQSFIKDVFLLAFIGYIYANRHLISPLFSRTNNASILWGVTGLSAIFTFYCLYYLPIKDFRPYQVGNDIQEQMELPEDAKETIYENVFFYKNTETGEIHEFVGAGDLPSGDEWEFEDREDKLIQEGDEPPIWNFSLYNRSGDEVTDDFLNQNGYKLMIVQHDLNSSNRSGQEKINELTRELNSEFNNGDNIWALTSSGDETIEQYIFENDVPYDFYTADPVMLKTIVRSNPGVLLLNGNKILGKWPSTNVPDASRIARLME